MKSLPTPVIDVKKYGGKQVAVSGGKIIASGRTLEEVLRKVYRILPPRARGRVRIFSVPKTLQVIYHA